MRDYLADAQKWMQWPLPIRQMLATDYGKVVATIVVYLRNDDVYKRKYAAYCLGQIGDQRVLEILQGAHDSEPAEGVRHAMAAALKTIRKMPASSGSTEEQRCQYMQEVYEAAMPDDIRQQMLAARGETKPQSASSTATKASSGCLSVVGAVLLLIVIGAVILIAR